MAHTSKVLHLTPARAERAAAAQSGGYIRLFRSLQDSAFSSKPEFVSAWVHMLLLATHKPYKTMLGNRSIQLLPGQFISGRKALAQTVGVTEKQMRTILDFMTEEGMITKESQRSGTVFTILNFEFYQDPEGQRSTPLEARNDAGSSEKRASKGPTQGQRGPTQGQRGPTLLGQQKGQAQASNHGGCSESGANERANPKTAKRATKQENNIYTTTPTARACESSTREHRFGVLETEQPIPQAEVEELTPHSEGQTDPLSNTGHTGTAMHQPTGTTPPGAPCESVHPTPSQGPQPDDRLTPDHPQTTGTSHPAGAQSPHGEPPTNKHLESEALTGNAAPGTHHHEQRQADSTGQPGSMITSRPPPAPPDTFAMHLDWQPSEAFPHRCQQAGIDLGRIDVGDATTWLGEFRSYWEANATECTQAKWEHKLIRQLLWQLEQQANKTQTEKPDWNDTGWAKGFDPFDEFSEFRKTPRANPLDPKERRAAITASVMDVTNTDWGI